MKKKQRNVYRHEIKSEIKEQKIKDIEGVLDLIFGDYENEWANKYVLKYRHFSEPKATIINRINFLWVCPIFYMIAPFRWVMFGEYQLNEDSRFFKIIKWLIGEPK